MEKNIGLEQEINLSLVVPVEVVKLANLMKDEGGELVLTGGWVRDRMFEKHHGKKMASSDIDGEIRGISPEKLKSILETQGLKNNNRGKFGTVELAIPSTDLPIELSVTKSRNSAGVRDFTINSLTYNPLDNRLEDRFGGLRDVRSRTLRVVDERVVYDDPVVAFKALQLVSRFELQVDLKTLNAIERVMGSKVDLKKNKERITREMIKLFTSKRPSMGLDLALKTGYFKNSWPMVDDMDLVDQPEKFHPEGSVWQHSLQVVDAAAEIAKRENLSPEKTLALELAAFFHDVGKVDARKAIGERIVFYGHEFKSAQFFREFAKKHTFPQSVVSEVNKLISYHMRLQDLKSQSGHESRTNAMMRSLSADLGESTSISMLCMLYEADKRGRNKNSLSPLEKDTDLQREIDWFLAKAEKLQIEKEKLPALLESRDVLSLATELTPGPWVGVVMKMVYRDQIRGEVQNVEEAQSAARKYLNQVRSMSTEDILKFNRSH